MVTDESFPTTWRELVETYGSRLKRAEERGEASARQATLDRLLEVAATVLSAETIEALRAKGDPVAVLTAVANARR